MPRLVISSLFMWFGFVSAATADGAIVRTTTRMLSDPLGYLFAGQADVSALLGAGTDPHTYQPTRKDVRSLAQADAVIHHGLLFEAQLLGLMQQLEGRIPVKAAEAFQQSEQLLYVEGYADPHTWHDPAFWIETVIDVAETVETDLGLDLAMDRVEILREAALGIDSWIVDAFGSVPEDQRIIISAHDAFSYYGQRYSLTLEPLLGLSTASETKLSRVNELVDLIVTRGVSAVFSETSVESAGIAALREGAASRGVELRALPPLYSDALGADEELGGTYFGMLIANTINMVDATSGQRPSLPPTLSKFLISNGLLTPENFQ